MRGMCRRLDGSDDQKGGTAGDEESMGKDAGDGIDLRRPVLVAGDGRRFRTSDLPDLHQAAGRTRFFAGKPPGKAGGYSGLPRPSHSFGFLGDLVTGVPQGGSLLIKIVCPVSIEGFSLLPHRHQRKPEYRPPVSGEGILAVSGSSGSGRESGAALRIMDDSDQLSD